MILDGLLAFTATVAGGNPSVGDSLINATGTFNTSNVLDLGLIGLPLSSAGGGARDLGIGDDPALKILAELTTAVAGTTGTTTLQLVLQGAPDNGSGVPGSYYNMILSPVYTFVTGAQLGVAGQRLLEVDVPRYPEGQPVPRFLRLQYIIGGASITAGVLEALIVLDRFDQIGAQTAILSGYPAGINIAN
ncbi:MAG: hypothetical protein HRJ53_30275 [Acidobacteria bacterium Pan2503]|uniref:Uncharacterized protein n=1 Tax=Candidatus Acidiferrum panamense TaxID=2741543 RepID=A0A7V8NXF8_9BACT|nr:hypothetical protein [Candidatus Acidoferrum panamensis]